MGDNNVIGSASFEIRATKEKLRGDLAAGEAEVKESLGRIERDTATAGGRIGNAIGRAASATVAAVGSLITILGLAAGGALNLGLQGTRMADDIANSAKKIGVGTNALQEWRYVATQTGADAKAADSALDSFATKLAQATAGTSKSAVKAFSSIGLGQDQLASFKSTEQALETVVDRIKNLKDETSRVAAAAGVGLGPLSAALRGNAIDVAALRDEARELGIVMDSEMIRRASQAQGEFDRLSKVVEIDLKGAFVDLAPAILTAIGLVANLARSLSDALDQWRDLDAKTSRGIRRQDTQQSAEQLALINMFGSPAAMRGQVVRARPIEGEQYSDLNLRQSAGVLVTGARNLPSAERDPTLNFWENISRNSNNLINAPQYVDAAEHFAALNRSRVRNGAELASRADVDTPARTNRPDGGTLDLPATRDRSAERDAERLARERLRNQRSYEDELANAAKDTLRYQEAFATTAAERASNAIMALDMERQELRTKLDRQEADGDITKTQRKQVEAAAGLVFSTREAVIAQELEKNEIEDRAAIQRDLSEFTASLLSAQSGLATSTSERLEIELELLKLHQDERRRALQRAVDDTTLSDAKRKAAQMALDQLPALESAEDQGVRRSNANPLQQWRNASLDDPRRMNDALAAVAADGLDALNQGLVDAIMNSKSLGETFSNVAKGILADLLSISVRRGITEPLADALFGGKGGGGGGGNIFASIGRLFGFSTGGEVSGPGTGTSDSILARLSNGEFVVSARQAQRHLPLLKMINAGALPGFASGGLVGASESGGELLITGFQMRGAVR